MKKKITIVFNAEMINHFVIQLVFLVTVTDVNSRADNNLLIFNLIKR